MNKILEVKNLKKQYIMGEVTVNALAGTSFELIEGEFVVILGASGSGKSTLLNIIGGIDKATSGEVLYKNKSINEFNEKQLTQFRRVAVGFVFQFYNLIPNLTAKENILLSSELSTNPIDITELIDKIGLTGRENHFPSQMSGGQQQRVAIARAIAKNPDMLLCDEPTGALDFNTGIQVLRLLKDFNREYKKTVVIITHNTSIGEIGDRIFYVKDGTLSKIIENENPKSPEEVLW